jgi:hypothetical protein
MTTLQCVVANHRGWSDGRSDSESETCTIAL